MRTVTFSSIFNAVLARMGMDPTILPPSNVQYTFSEYITSAVRTAWESYPWPDALAFEMRQFYPSWNTNTSYALGAGVLGSDNVYYQAVQASTGVDPTTDTSDTYWISQSTLISNGTPMILAISLDQSGATPIGEVINVFSCDPRNNRVAPELSYEITGDGILFHPWFLSPPATVCVKFTTRPQTYSTSSLTNGDTVPYVIAEAVKAFACGMALREDGQFDKAAAMDQVGMNYLEDEFQKIESKQNQFGSFKLVNK